MPLGATTAHHKAISDKFSQKTNEMALKGADNAECTRPAESCLNKHHDLLDISELCKAPLKRVILPHEKHSAEYTAVAVVSTAVQPCAPLPIAD